MGVAQMWSACFMYHSSEFPATHTHTPLSVEPAPLVGWNCSLYHGPFSLTPYREPAPDSILSPHSASHQAM